MKFINQFINVDMVLMPKCNDDWTIDYIKVIIAVPKPIPPTTPDIPTLK